MKRHMVGRTRNGGTWTEAQFWGRIRGALRKTFAAWVPMKAALNASRRASQRADRPLLKFEYQCAICKNWFALKSAGKEGKQNVHVDHKVPAGSLRNFEDLPGWIARLTDEDPSAYQVVCIECHQEKTNTERDIRSATKSTCTNPHEEPMMLFK